MDKNKLLPIAALLAIIFSANAEEIRYPEALLQELTNGKPIDLSYIQNGHSVAPGVYQTTIRINKANYFSQEVEFRDHEGHLEPVFTAQDLLNFPLSSEMMMTLSQSAPTEEYFPLAAYFAGVKTHFDGKQQVLDIAVPQIYLAKENDRYDVVPKPLWQDGINAVVLNYSLSAGYSKGRGENDYTTTDFTSIVNSQINLGTWRLFTNGSYEQNRRHYADDLIKVETLDWWNTYLQRDLPSIDGTLQIGESYTNGDIFNSFPMRGLRLFSNTSMLPMRDRSYAPVIEGVAHSDAQIVVRMNNHVIHTENVAAGPFRLDDLPFSYSSSDYEIIIKESNGTERILTVPNSSVPQMLKQGQFRYEVNAGQYYRRHMHEDMEKLPFIMGTVSVGLPEDITLYGGVLTARNYLSGVIGTGLSLGNFGALAFDGAYARVSRDYNRQMPFDDGVAFRLRYEKTMLSTGTTVSFANYRYTSGNYKDFEDAAEFTPAQNNQSASLKDEWNLALSQRIFDSGHLTASLHYRNYRDDVPDLKTYSFGYGTGIHGIGVNFNYSREYRHRTGFGWKADQTAMVSLNIPLDLFFYGSSSKFLRSTRLDYSGSMRENSLGHKTYTQRVSANGSAIDSDWTWHLSQQLGHREERETYASVVYGGERFDADASVTHSHAHNSYRAGLTGGMLLHAGGLTTMRRSWDSIALVEVPQTPGVRLQNSFDAVTDFRGYAVVPYLNNYSRNEITVDPSTLPDGTLMSGGTSQVVYPKGNSIVKVVYPVEHGAHAMFTLKQQDAYIPFGATVVLVDETGSEKQTVISMVGQNGRAYMTGIPPKGTLRVKYMEKQKPSVVDYVYDLDAEGIQGELPTVTLNK